MKLSFSAPSQRYVYDGDGRLLGDYGASATAVKGEFVWLLPEAANDNVYGGDDGIGGYALLAVTSGTTAAPVIQWVFGNHLGTLVVTTDAGGAVVVPASYAALGY